MVVGGWSGGERGRGLRRGPAGEPGLAGEPASPPLAARCLPSAEPRLRVKRCRCECVRRRLPAVTGAASRPPPRRPAADLRAEIPTARVLRDGPLGRISPVEC